VTLQQSGVCAAISPKDSNLHCGTIVAARVAHNLVKYDKQYDKQYLNLGATPRHISQRFPILS